MLWRFCSLSSFPLVLVLAYSSVSCDSSMTWLLRCTRDVLVSGTSNVRQDNTVKSHFVLCRAQGRPGEASVGDQALQYGGVDTKDFVPGTEVQYCHDRQTHDRRTARQGDRWTNGRTDRQIGKRMDGEPAMQANREMDERTTDERTYRRFICTLVEPICVYGSCVGGT